MFPATAHYRWYLALCLVGVALGLAPAKMAARWRGVVRDGLRPGQTVVHAAVARTKQVVTALPANKSRHDTRVLAARLAAAERRNRWLEVRLEAVERRWSPADAPAGGIPFGESRAALFVPQLVEARVLGETSAMLWRARKLAGAGTAAGVVESSLVLDDDRLLLDQGADARVSRGDAVYAGRCVVGKIVEAGRHSSTLQLVTDTGYSGRARLARRTSSGLAFGSEGTLVGAGEAHCRLRHIHEPVNVGDEVFTGGADGILPYAMYYGRVVRAELDPGAIEWSIEVRPAATLDQLEYVQILRLELNSGRMLAD